MAPAGARVTRKVPLPHLGNRSQCRKSCWRCQDRWNGARSAREERTRGAGPAEGREGCAGSRTKCDPSHARNQREVKRKPQRQRNFQIIENKFHKMSSHFTSSLKKKLCKRKIVCVHVHECVCDNPTSAQTERVNLTVSVDSPA